MTTAQYLRDAADIIREHGLAKGSYRALDRPNCAHCVMGAVIEAIEPVPSGGFMDIYACQASGPLIEVARTIDPDYKRVSISYFDVIYKWNDAEERTTEEVIDVLERTADRLEVQS